MSKVIKTALVAGALYVSHKATFTLGQAWSVRNLVLIEQKNPGTFDKVVKEYEKLKSNPDD